MRTYSVMCDQCGWISNHLPQKHAVAALYNHEKTHTSVEHLGLDTTIEG